MQPAELAARAQQYVHQALDRLNTVESRVTVPTEAVGDWTSLRANLESAKADLDSLPPIVVATTDAPAGGRAGRPRV
jgi:hypothetical protein